MNSTVRRSWLIVPAHDEKRLEQTAKSGADVVVLDLEDTVHDSRKHEARENIRDAIGVMRNAGSEVFVRCDPELLYADIAASVWRGLSGVVLPGLTSADQIVEADSILSQFESERGVVRPPPVGEVREADDPRGPEQALEIHLSLDTGPANWHAEELIQASDRIQSISLGRADLKMDLREEPSGDLHLLPYLMQRLIVIANALGSRACGRVVAGDLARPRRNLRRHSPGRNDRTTDRIQRRALHEGRAGRSAKRRVHSVRRGGETGSRRRGRRTRTYSDGGYRLQHTRMVGRLRSQRPGRRSCTQHEGQRR